MSAQRFLKLEEALELLNSLDSDKSDVEIAVLPPDARELTVEDEGDENEVNNGEINVNDVPSVWRLELEIVSSLNHLQALVARQRRAEKMLKDTRILLLTGYHSNTCERDSWSDAEDLGITLGKCPVTKPLPKVEILFTLCGQ
ncbi:hypothetical protein TNCV_4655171 [Trichonephila clavipes]|nr:hypothetical protein TNCV_4655171 [Trichonephila clavipes]